MANFDIIMPKMGESIEEATITNWFVKEGDMVEEDDVLLEIATDKVDSEIPSPVEGVIKKIFFKQDEVVAVGTVIAVIGLDGDDSSSTDEKAEAVIEEEVSDSEPEVIHEKKNDEPVVSSQGRFYSPLVRTIAGKEGVSQDELDAIEGSGLNGRVRKEDLLNYIGQKLDLNIELVQRETYAEINEMLPTGQLDIAFICTGPYASGHVKYGFEVKKGSRYLASL